MAKRLLEKKILIDGFISSTANRAFTTASYFAKAYHFPQNKIEKIQQLYHAYPADFYQVVSKLDDQINSAAIFSHNPGITEFVNSLTDTKIDNMPTCGIFAIKADIKHWKDFTSGIKTLWFFDYPKL
jgi:phosphohistidine phosphatase